jgi:hypothetical protein
MLWKFTLRTMAVPVAMGVTILSGGVALGDYTSPRLDHIVIVIEENHS